MGELLRPTHLLLIVIVFVLLFGTSKLGALGKGLGEGIRNFKSAMKDGEEKKEDQAPGEKKS